MLDAGYSMMDARNLIQKKLRLYGCMDVCSIRIQNFGIKDLGFGIYFLEFGIWFLYFGFGI